MFCQMQASRIAALCLGVALAILTTSSSANPMSTMENFYNRAGNDYHNYNSGSAAQCASSCATNAQCLAYTYVRTTKMCWMKDKVPKRTKNNCCMSGVKIMNASEFGFDRPGSDIAPGYNVTSSSKCESDCRHKSNCRSYTFVKAGVQGNSAKCWLKNAKPAKVANSCCVSGTKRTPKPAMRVPSSSLQVAPRND